MKMVVIDADYTYNKKAEPVIRLYGKLYEEDINDENVCLHVWGFEPYIYVGYNRNDLDYEWKNIIELKEIVEKVLKGYVKEVKVVKRYEPIGYQEEKTDFLKLILFNPRTVPDVRKILNEKLDISNDYIYEADILFKDRFLIDTGINCMDIIEFNGKKLKNYGLGCNNLYICNVNSIKVCNEDIKVDY
jgi:DNA polymerase elongation subunit (family B)